LLAAVKTFLESKGYTNIFTDYWPAEPDEIIGLFCWDHTGPPITDGTSTRYIQVRVRRYDADQACSVCQAITTLLDSGTDETPIPLTYPGAVIGRPRRFPRLMERDERTATYYSENALWGKT
jgi:hypothetical protein